METTILRIFWTSKSDWSVFLGSYIAINVMSKTNTMVEVSLKEGLKQLLLVMEEEQMEITGLEGRGRAVCK
jgi:hypothetical protein